MELGVTVDGEGMIRTENGKGQALVLLSAYEEEGIIFTTNDKGEVTSMTPSNPKTSD